MNKQLITIVSSAEILQLLEEEGLTPPPIPEGCNTLTTRCVIEGRAAILINQSGFVADDRESPGEEVNGLTMLLCTDTSLTESESWELLDRTVRDLLERQ